MKAHMWKGWGVLLVSLFAWGPAWGADNPKGPGVPGTVNYVEGRVSMGGNELDSKSIGSAVIEAGQTLDTGEGKAEVLLTPGVFFRVGNHSAARMLSAGLTNTEIELDQGRAFAEVAEIHPENNLRVREGGATIRLEKAGLYEFNRDENLLRVFEGKATVDSEGRHITVKSKHEVTLGDSIKLAAQKFDRNSSQGDDLYNWSSLRSAYLAEANVNEASYYEQYGWGPGGPMWWGAGWYWDPWFDAFTFLPGDGIFFSPFGWGFYAPWCVYQAPFYGYGYGFGHTQFYHHFSSNTATWGPGSHYTTGQNYAKGVYRGPGSTGAAFHSGGRMTGIGGFAGGARGVHSGGGLHGGGFHGGGFQGGGFHGGFGGGGFHGGGATIGGHGH